ncbi:MAG: VanZ family protein [Sideroxydans sp.]|nr:VanZ family protein [Sideroxydans sp.]
MPALLQSANRSLLRRYLLAGYVLMIVYASLSPFAGWQASGVTFVEVLASPLSQAYTAFDAVANWLAYLPLGMLLALNLIIRFKAVHSVLLATLAALVLSMVMEYLQMYLPMRAAASVDVLTNSVGALCGAVLAVLVAPQPWFARATQWRIELFERGDGVDFGLALVMLWMFAQINPSLPMLGNVFLTEEAGSIAAFAPSQFSLWASAAVACNLLLIGLLLQTLFRIRRHVAAALLLMLSVVALGKFISAAVLLRSWALMLWLNGEAVLGLLAGLALTGASFWLPRAALSWAALATSVAYLALAAGVLDSAAPAAAMRLYHWHYGHLRNFNWMSQIASAVFPLLLMIYLVWARRRIMNAKEKD